MVRMVLVEGESADGVTVEEDTCSAALEVAQSSPADAADDDVFAPAVRHGADSDQPTAAYTVGAVGLGSLGLCSRP
jgi:hypothetical protein